MLFGLEIVDSCGPDKQRRRLQRFRLSEPLKKPENRTDRTTGDTRMKTSRTQSASGIPSPRAFMRMRHPERFSDSVIESTQHLDRTTLETTLVNIGAANKEYQFEVFARRLVEARVCPNLIPNTGPAAGGDGKVDSETYPVAEALTHTWFMGEPGATTERWAIAVSTQKTWKAKLTADVKKIVATGRGYTRAIYVTNQYIPSKTRTETEDGMSASLGIKVTIFDLSWILDKTLSNGHEKIAVDSLSLALSLIPSVRQGPGDVSKAIALKDIEIRIAASVGNRAAEEVAVTDTLKAATLARDLERPRTEVDGCFARALRHARKSGTRHDEFLALYTHAWTSYFWYEDAGEMFRLFDEALALIDPSEQSHNPDELEFLGNLITAIEGAIREGHLSEDVDIAARRLNVIGMLERMASDEQRPSAALSAKANLAILKIPHAILLGDVSKELNELKIVLEACEGFIGFAVEPIIKIIAELGDALGHLEQYAELFEAATSVSSSRVSDIQKARMRIRRGRQQMKTGDHYGALQSTGPALSLLYKEETKREMIEALLLSGTAHERVDLLWAARGNFLLAASLLSGPASGLTRLHSRVYEKLKMIELRLGRLPEALTWQRVDAAVKTILIERDGANDDLLELDIIFEAGLGLHFLRADLTVLERLTKLPDALERLGLPLAGVALMKALGHESKNEADFIGDSDPEKFYGLWLAQPIRYQLSEMLTVGDEDYVVLQSQVLGCRITVEADNFPAEVAVAESLIAAIEAFLSTGPRHRLVPVQPQIELRVRRGDRSGSSIEYSHDTEGGRYSAYLTCNLSDSGTLPAVVQHSAREVIMEALSNVVAHCFLSDVTTIESLIRDEAALERALGFTGSLVVVSNVLGSGQHSRVLDITDGMCEYVVARTCTLESELDYEPFPMPKSAEPMEGDQAAAPHGRLQARSLIRVGLWDRAEWQGIGFIHSGNPAHVPELLLLFSDRASAEQIVAGLIEDVSKGESLRVSIVRGVQATDPNVYRMVIGSSVGPDATKDDHVSTVSRVKEMRPISSDNLNGFLGAYVRSGRCRVRAAVNDGSAAAGLRLVGPDSLVIDSVTVRDAWSIGRHDEAVVGIRHDDDILIPDNHSTNAPVLEVLAWLAKNH